MSSLRPDGFGLIAILILFYSNIPEEYPPIRSLHVSYGILKKGACLLRVNGR
jgi:hypothetical protein